MSSVEERERLAFTVDAPPPGIDGDLRTARGGFWLDGELQVPSRRRSSGVLDQVGIQRDVLSGGDRLLRSGLGQIAASPKFEVVRPDGDRQRIAHRRESQ